MPEPSAAPDPPHERCDPHLSIHEIHIELPSSDGVRYDPPERILNVAVVGDDAFLQVQHSDEKGRLGEVQSEIRVSARSLIRSLQTLLDDQDAEK